MKEIKTGSIYEGETRMKKMLLIAVLALALMLALGASPAYAKYAGFNSAIQYVPWTTATSMASNNADAALMQFGPHNGYATTTIKCAVCHSVHRADTSLLNDGTGGCAVCHTNAYYGGTALAALVSWKVTSGGGPHSSFCNSGSGEACHAGPHGVGASTYAGASSKLLDTDDARIAAAATANYVTLTTASPWSDPNMRVLGTDGTCVRCHTNSVFGIIKAGTKLDVVAGVSGLATGTVTGHRVIAAATSNWNANGTDFPSGKTGIKIAWNAVTYCASCHDLTDDNNGGANAFPHAINDVISTAQGKIAGNRAAVWLTAAPDSATQSLAVSGYDQYTVKTGGTVVSNAAGSTILDGICLKCHRSATSGIGIDF